MIRVENENSDETPIEHWSGFVGSTTSADGSCVACGNFSSTEGNSAVRFEFPSMSFVLCTNCLADMEDTIEVIRIDRLLVPAFVGYDKDGFETHQPGECSDA